MSATRLHFQLFPRRARPACEHPLDGLLMLNNLLYFGPLVLHAGMLTGPLPAPLASALVRGGAFTLLSSALAR